MKRTLILIMAIALLTATAAIPAFAEEAAGTPDQITSATVQDGGETPASQQPAPGGNRPSRFTGNTPNGRMPAAPGRSNGNGQNNQQPGTPGKDGRAMKQGKGITGRNKGRNYVDPNQLLAEGVITREVYDAIVNWLSVKTRQQTVSAAPAGSAEAPAVTETEQESPELRLLKELLGSGVITQEQYDLLAAGYAAADPADAT